MPGIFFEPNAVTAMKLYLRRTLVHLEYMSALCKAVQRSLNHTCSVSGSKNILLFCCTILSTAAFAQSTDSTIISGDSSSMQNVIVTAFASQLKWKDVPASVAFLSKQNLQRYDGSSLVPAMNTVPGVRMEERSPGSYRLSVRGSLLRSPFGVRNVKVYWDDIPLTDAGGNTYINLIDVNNLQSVEIIKGPSASFYGANTGGAVILRSDDKIPVNKNVFNASLTGGSFGLFNEQAGWRYGNKKFVSNLQQSHLQSDGYRQHSTLKKDVVKWNSKWDINQKESLSFLAFYSNLQYETPGGLTQPQFDLDPKLASQPSGTFPGAVAKKAAVYNKTYFAGTSLRSSFTKNFGYTTAFVINHSDFVNPTTRNYEKRNEWNYSGRTDFNYNIKGNGFTIKANAGAELQYNNSFIRDYGNVNGNADTAQSADKIHISQYFLFAQLNMHIGTRLLLQAGASRNEVRYWYHRTLDLAGQYPQIKKAGPTVSPRFGTSYTITKELSVYASAAKGFSAPTLDEVQPTTADFNKQLQPEFGWNYEAGIKGTAFKTMLEYNASFYYFNLKDAIVRRNDANGVAYYINAGSTIQKGVEFWFNAHIINSNKHFITALNIWNSYSYQPYRFNEYVVGSSIFSGKKLTGVPRTINVSGIDIKTKHNWYANITFNYTSDIPLNDGNTVYAADYRLLQTKVGKQFIMAKSTLHIFAGADNLLNQVYSLGNDINAAGSRYFNAAPLRNFYAGMHIEF